MKKTKYYIFGFCVWILFINGSCILWLGTTPCEIPIAKTIGVNDSFLITPLKDSYNAGEQIIVKFTIDSKARLYDDKDVVFDLFKKTNKNEALLFGEHSGNFDNLTAVSNGKTIKLITGENKEYGGYAYLYQPKTDSYVLEFEMTLLDKRKYIIDGFHLEINLGKREINNCHYYVHSSIIKFDPPISFEVK